MSNIDLWNQTVLLDFGKACPFMPRYLRMYIVNISLITVEEHCVCINVSYDAYN